LNRRLGHYNSEKPLASARNQTPAVQPTVILTVLFWLSVILVQNQNFVREIYVA
jgi:hypothetical protein